MRKKHSKIRASAMSRRRHAITASARHTSLGRRYVRAAAGSGVMLKTETAEGTYYLTKSSTKKQTHWTKSYDSANRFAKKDSAVNKLYSIILKGLEEYAFYNPDDVTDIMDESELKKAKFAKFYITDLSGKTIEDISTEVKNHLLSDDEFVSYFADDLDDDDFDDEDDIEESTKVRGRRTIKANSDIDIALEYYGFDSIEDYANALGYGIVDAKRALLSNYEDDTAPDADDGYERLNALLAERRRSIKASSDDQDITITYNGQVVYTGSVYDMYGAIYRILFKDATARVETANYLNEFGDPLIDNPERASASEVAGVLAKLVKYDLDDFGDDLYEDIGAIEIFTDESVNAAKSVKCSTRRRRTIRASADRPYLYVLKHGLGPGTLPRDVEIIKTDEYNGYTLVWLDRFLTTSELNQYDIPSESNLERYLGDYYDEFVGATTVLSARDTTIDKDAVRELVLYITNDASLYPQVQAIVKNMKQKIKRGKYDDELAVKAWQYLADAGVAKYDREFGSGGGTKAMLNKATREQIARELRDYYADMVNEDVEASEGLVTM